MTVALTDGPLGLEAIHVWTPGDGAAALTMNDLSTRFRIKFDRMQGWRALPEADNNAFPRTARIGETPLPSLVRGKTLTIEGRMQAASMQLLRQMEWAMATAFGERDLEGTWSAIPNPGYGDNTAYWQTAGRILQYDPDEELTRGRTALPSPYQAHFLLGIRQSDPRWTWSAAQTATAAGQTTVTNQGNAPAEPTISVTSPGATTVIYNDTLTKKLRFTSVPAGSPLIVNFAARTALLGAVDALPYLDSYTSDWWDRSTPGLRPGANIIRQTGGTGLTVAWKHTSW